MDYSLRVLEILKSETFNNWLADLKDRQARVRIVLLAGGDKGSQEADIERAIKIARNWKD